MDPSSLNNEPMHSSANEGFLDVIRFLLEDDRVDPTANTAIVWASLNGFHEIVYHLLQDPRVDPSDAQDNALRWYVFAT